MKKYNFNTPWDNDYWMKSNGFFCGFNMPPALKTKEKNGEEVLNALPPYNWRSSFLVDEYPACPSNWMLSEGKLTSYFVPVKMGEGMWLDFNKCAKHPYDVAIIVSIQGVNAITGLPCNDAQLEQYIEECPKHKKKFGPNRLCEECGYKWPKQNYIATTGTPNGYLWLDGFRAANGVIQQYILTENAKLGVASNIIGSKRVYAIGISFFLSTSKKTNYKNTNNYDASHYSFGNTTKINTVFDVYPKEGYDSTAYITVSNNNFNRNVNDTASNISFNDELNEITKKLANTPAGDELITTHHCFENPQFFSPVHTPINWQIPAQYSTDSIKIIEIGAGASINQQVYEDPSQLDYWRNSPEALLCINYCAEEEVIKILEQGKINKQGHPKGFLKDIPSASKKETV